MAGIAIVQTAFIGDVVLTTPLFEAARKSNPYDEIIGVVRESCQNLLQNNPFVDTIIVWDKHGRDRGFRGMVRVAGKLREHDIHTALIPHRSVRTALTLYFAGIGTRIGFAKGSGAFLHTVRVLYAQGIHEVERNLMLADAAGWESNGLMPAIFPDATDCAVVEKVLSGSTACGVLAPGSVWATKIWPQESYIKVGKHFAAHGVSVVISGSESDEELCRGVTNGIPGAVNVCGKLTLRQSAELYRRAAFLLTGDTAPQHLGAAVGARVFSIFGPTVQRFGFWPYTSRGVVIEENMDCRPCGVHGHKSCPRGTHECMRRITAERVIEIITREIQ